MCLLCLSVLYVGFGVFGERSGKAVLNGGGRYGSQEVRLGGLCAVFVVPHCSL